MSPLHLKIQDVSVSVSKDEILFEEPPDFSENLSAPPTEAIASKVLPCGSQHKHPSVDEPLTILKSHFQFESFRPGQEEVIQRLLSGNSSLAVFPTGQGKSLCYQLPARIIAHRPPEGGGGMTVVVSPLISLIKDQLDAMNRAGTVVAATIGSSQTFAERHRVVDQLNMGQIQVLMIAPEQLNNENTVALLSRQRIALFVVDEAHCISEWGNSFRPDYLRLAQFARNARVGTTLCLTATANKKVIKDICTSFSIDQQKNCIQFPSFRSNLALHFTVVNSEVERVARITALISERRGSPMIVYATTIEQVDSFCAYLCQRGFSARAYHSMLDVDVRQANQEWFMRGEDVIMVATIAFGMGIDKKNIRTIIHYNIAKSVEGYVQEIGRAGRDGLPALCHKFASRSDIAKLEDFASAATPSANSIYRVLKAFFDSKEYVISPTPNRRGETRAIRRLNYSFGKEFDMNRESVNILLAFMEIHHGLTRQVTGTFETITLKFANPNRPVGEMKAFLREKLEISSSGGDADVIKSIASYCKSGRVQASIDLDNVVSSLQEAGVARTRTDILALLSRLGPEVYVTPRGHCNQYEIHSPLASPDVFAIALTEVKRSHDREKSEIHRLRQVLQLIHDDGCKAKYLLSHFGDDARTVLGEEERCGICSSCVNRASTVSATPGAPLLNDVGALSTQEKEAQWTRLSCADQLTNEDWTAAVAFSHQHPYLRKSPRALARYLLGYKSPLVTPIGKATPLLFGWLAGKISWSALLERCEREVGITDSSINVDDDIFSS